MALAFAFVAQEQALIHSRWQWQLARYAIESGAQHDRQGKVRIATGVAAAQFYARRQLAISAGTRDANQSLAIDAPPVYVYGGFIAWHQALVRVDQGREN